MKCRTIGTDPKTRREVSVLSLGAMRFGTATGEATSFAILDRYVEAGGTFIDTADNYAFWANGTQGLVPGIPGDQPAACRGRAVGAVRHTVARRLAGAGLVLAWRRG